MWLGCSEFLGFPVKIFTKTVICLFSTCCYGCGCHNFSLVIQNSESYFPLQRAGEQTFKRIECKWWKLKISFIVIFLGLVTEIRHVDIDSTYLKMAAIFCVCIQLVQVIINTTHLEQSCHYLEEFISNITNVPPHTANATKLYGTSTFKVLLRTSFTPPHC